ncbi:MAG: hypothetical protein A2W47_04560 [Gammaproteobacteria bacterium RIFCSPHIGHO2_12_38_15]|nr:MAG: hypothetical protein A2W47_04560 [Gammaproteobacteria bacterium RIFCSPHIGHO2_12_38_15]
MPNLIYGQDPGGGRRPVQVDDNGNLSIDLVSGVSVSAVVDATNPLQVHQVSGSAWSTEGSIAHDAADSGNPVKIGGVARTTNPTAVANADRVNASYDDLGRQVITPYQVRDLIQTAYVALANGTETNLLAGIASTYLDLAWIMAANTSDAAIDIDVRCGTGYGVLLSLTVPADATAGIAPAVPIPQDNTGQPWTVDIGDLTGTTVNISALFIKNV